MNYLRKPRGVLVFSAVKESKINSNLYQNQVVFQKNINNSGNLAYIFIHVTFRRFFGNGIYDQHVFTQGLTI